MFFNQHSSYVGGPQSHLHLAFRAYFTLLLESLVHVIYSIIAYDMVRD